MAHESIWIIEDDTIQREALVTELRQHGFTVVAAVAGNEVLHRLYNGPAPDLILLDMLIPSGDHDGWWFLRQREHNPTLASVPVIIMTSLSVACEAWALSLGAAGLVQKPYDADALLGEIQKCLSHKVPG